MPTQIIKRRNFSAPLPGDFYIMKSLIRKSTKDHLVCRQFPTQNDYCCESFMIGKDRLFFSGNFSRRPFIKWWQKLKEAVVPVRYKIDYVSVNERIEQQTKDK